MDISALIKIIFEKIKNDPMNIQAWEDCFESIKILGQTDKQTAVKYGLQLSDELPSHITVDNKNIKRYYDLYKKTLLYTAYDCLDSYLLYVEFERVPEKKFYLPRRNVLRIVVDDLQDLEDDKLDFLAVSLPTRTGKSTLGIFFLTWIMGKYPDLANVMSGYSDKLTKGFYMEVLSIIRNTEYLWADVFPGCSIARVSAEDESIDINATRRFPTLTCRTLGGTLTGAVEVGKLLYVDDIIEDLEEALNPVRLENKYDAYLNQLKDRKKKKAKELHIGTRWGVADVIGRIMTQYEGNPRYRFRVIPALNENDESNFDYPYNLGFDTKHYLDMRESIDNATWCAKFMGDPYVREGLAYPEDELRRYFTLPEGEPDYVLSICDTKDTGKDYAFMPAAYCYGNDLYIEDCICDNSMPGIVEARLTELLIRHKVKACRFESNAAGGRIAMSIQNSVLGRGGITHITTRHTSSNKETRIILTAHWIKTNCLFKDSSMYKQSSDYAKAMKFLTTYTIVGKNKNDDVPDGMSMLAEFKQSLASNRVKVEKRTF